MAIDSGFPSPLSRSAKTTSSSISPMDPAVQAILDEVPGSWFFMRSNGTFAFANKEACRGLGYTREELMRTTIFHVDPTMTRENWSAMWAGTRPSESLTVRTRHRRKDGSEFPVEVRASRMLIDGEDLAASYTIDLTVSARTETLNRRLLAAIEQASEAVVVTDGEGMVEYVNPAWEQATGMREVEVRGRAWSTLEGAGDGNFLASLAQAVTSGVPWKGRMQSRRLSGQLYEEDVSLSPIRDDPRKIVGWVAVKRDITEQLRLEEQLRRAQKVETVGQLAGGIAHDFNNLLQVIHGQTHLIQMHSTNPSEIEPMLGEITQAVDRASSLVRQLLAFSCRGTVEFAVLRLDEVVGALHGMLRRLLGEHIELEWASDTGPIFVRGNAAQLEQVVVNLCINARDAMPHGGTLRVKLSPGTSTAVSDGATQPGGATHLGGKRTVVLSVSDSGSGMTDEVRERLFQPFFTTKERGTGLGLATVQAVVHAHGGAIDVTSVPGEGSTFRVVLPLVEARAEPRDPPRHASIVAGAGRLALVAEDEPGVRDLTVLYLQRAGFRVLTASDGAEAELVMAQSPEPISIVVLDAVMPRRSGQAVFEALRARGDSTPVVFVTGYDYESLAQVTRQSAVAIVQKPFSADELLGVIGGLLESASSAVT